MARNSGLLLLVAGAGALGAAFYFSQSRSRSPSPSGAPIAGAGVGAGGMSVIGDRGGFDPDSVRQIEGIVNQARRTSEAQGGLDKRQRLETAIAVLKAAAQGVQDPTRKESIMAKVAELEAQLAAMG